METSQDARRAPSSSFIVLLVISMAIFTDEYIFAAIIPILPFLLIDRIGIDESHVQTWTSNLIAVYAVVTIVTSPLIGWISDRPGLRKRFYIGGLLLTALSTVAFALGRNVWILVLGRVLQSLSTSIVRSAGMAMLKESASADRQGALMGYVAISQTLGIMAGPAISGWLYEKVSYAAVWIVIGAILFLDLVARLFMPVTEALKQSNVNVKPDSNAQRPDGSNNDAESHREETPLLRQDSKTPAARYQLLMTLSAFVFDQRVLTALWLCFVQAFLRTSLASTLPLFVSNTFKAKSGETAVLYSVLSIPLVVSVLIGMLFDRYGATSITVGGLVVGIPSFICLRFVTHHSPPQVALLVILLLICSSVMLLIGIPSMAVCSKVAGELEKAARLKENAIAISGQVFSMIRMSRALGQTLGPIIAAVLVERTQWAGMTAILGAICACSLVAVLSGSSLSPCRKQ